MRAFLVLATLALALVLTNEAGAASIAYVDNGEVWLSSLDGAQKVRLAAPVVNSSGAIDTWQDVAAADSGRIVAVRNQPGKNSSFSWFKVWEPDGTSTVEGPLNAPGGWAISVYPLSFDITADGKHLVYGYSNSGFCCPQTFARGTYVRPATNGLSPPIDLSGEEDPTLFGDRVIAHSGNTISVQDVGTPYGPNFTPWLDVTGTGLEPRRTDIAANGQLMAIGGEQWNGGTQTIGKIALLSVQGVGQPLAGPVDCFVPASGVAKDPSVSQDARTIAWTDGQGLKAAGAPVSAADPCEMTSPAVVISPTGAHASIGGANIGPFLPPAAPATPPVVTLAPPAPTLPAKLTAKALAAGVKLKVKLPEAGKVTVTATVPAKAMGRKGKPVTIGTGSANANGAGTVTVKLKLNSAARKRVKKLKGVKVTLRFVQNGRTTTKTVKLR